VVEQGQQVQVLEVPELVVLGLGSVQVVQVLEVPKLAELGLGSGSVQVVQV
jgi:hypothetical protein